MAYYLQTSQVVRFYASFMIRNNIKIALRNLNRFKGYTLINLTGLSLGLCCGILITLFVLDELSYDQFHTKKERIYKVYSDRNETNGWPIGIKLKEYPEVEAVLYARSASFLQVMHDNKRYSENAHFVSNDFFKIFSFDLLAGDEKTALEGPYKVVLTEDVAEKYFGSADVIGKTLVLGDSINFEVTGIMENVPRQSHMQFNMLVSFDTYPLLNTSFSYTDGWGNINIRNYVLLKEYADPEAFEAKVAGLYMDNIGDFLRNMGMEIYVNLQPLSTIYLKEGIGNGFGPKGSINQLYLVSAIGLFVILLACINFINLTTARSVYRAREVGVRKIVGSTRASLFWQFISESFVLTLIAFLFVGLLLDLVLPLFNELMGRSLSFSDLLQPGVLLAIVLLIIAITFLSGFYPAIVLSGFKPAETLKGKLTTSQRGASLRKGLVIFQFVVTCVLVLGTLLVVDQLNFMRDKDPGFNKEQVVVLNAGRGDLDALKLNTLKNNIRVLTSVQEVTFTNAFPGSPGWQGQWCTPEGFQKDESLSVEYVAVDADYISTMGLELIAGSNFNIQKSSDVRDGLIINETAVREMRWETPQNAIGRTITSPSGYPAGTVIGVVKDYHQEGLQKRIMPLVMDFAPEHSYYFAIKFTTGSTSALVGDLEKVWNAAFPDHEFIYYFLDDMFDRQYKAETRLINVLILFSVITIIIAVTGLFGLVSFMVVSRTREIGVRKVLGAGLSDITALLSWEFLKLVFIANIIAVPLLWYYGEKWLDNFAYRTDLNPTIFIVTFLICMGIALATVSFQTIRAALSNPIDSLRTE